jgi:3-deoxy-D-manno-octulosonic-acid transferase
LSTTGHAEPDWRYRALIAALGPLLAGHALWLALRARDPRMARQKFGFSLPHRNDRPLWLHMSSVGEVNAARPLVAALRRRRPELPILVTTFTPTGAATAAATFGTGVEHVYLPLDFRPGVRRFLRRVRPRCALVIETEIWPRLFHECAAEGVPLLIVNGRLSARTLDRPPWMRAIFGTALAKVDRILARSQTDADGFAALGAPAERIAVIDNLKFARPDAEAGPPAPITLPRPYIVAASTHDDEELRLARAWLASPLRASHLLVIVPRHPQRKASILAQLRPLGAPLAVRSDGDAVDAATELYLADTFGELPRFIAGAELVFTGGSLVPRGGQNVIEVARLGKTALFGPHMEHFADERDLLVDNDAAIAVADVDGLMREIARLLASPERLRAIGERAQRLVEARGDVAERYLEALALWLDEREKPGLTPMGRCG